MAVTRSREGVEKGSHTPGEGMVEGGGLMTGFLGQEGYRHHLSGEKGRGGSHPARG